jgi:hypothetical protein
MGKSRKYSTRVLQSESGWVAEILRRMTSKKQVVTKQKDGFTTEAEAQAWADTELQAFLERLSEQSKQRAVRRAKQQKYDLT